MVFGFFRDIGSVLLGACPTPDGAPLATHFLTERDRLFIPMSLSAGDKLGPHEILASLGAGGMGEVYRAQDTRLKREVALKILPEALAHDPVRRQRFEQEARAVAALNHPNIVAIYDIGIENGVL